VSNPADLGDALAGTLVLDASRMLPGAVLAKMLLGFGARVVKVEEPALGDPLRHAPPIVEGIGAGFRTFYAGAESLCLDLRSAGGSAALLHLTRRADVLVESFRPGTLDRWGIGPARLAAANPALVVCSLSSFGQTGGRAGRVGHDLNFVADSGLLAALDAQGVPGVQIADVSAGLLACSSVLAALLLRRRTGRGARVDQPLALATAPFLDLARAETEAGGGGASEGILAGRAPAYGLYECADGRRVALGALESKLWLAFVDAMGLPSLAAVGLDTGEAGRAATERIAARFAERPSAEWLAWAEARGVPLTAVRTTAEAAADPFYASRADGRRVPRPGEHTDAVLAETDFGRVEGDGLAR
jgi:crotonobetainyl-CoA:carnitine CoA-transferase CaiB-like acyl-CoA transferase